MKEYIVGKQQKKTLNISNFWSAMRSARGLHVIRVRRSRRHLYRKQGRHKIHLYLTAAMLGTALETLCLLQPSARSLARLIPFSFSFSRNRSPATRVYIDSFITSSYRLLLLYYSSYRTLLLVPIGLLSGQN
jgi:hypothetical protein